MNKGLGEWKRLSQRLRGMSPRELADRLRQHTTARVDFLRHKVGFDFEPRLLAGSVQAQPNYALPAVAARALGGSGLFCACAWFF